MADSKHTDVESQATASLQALDQATQDFQAPAPKTSALSAVQVPGYRIEGILGRGGMGVVYRAVQEKANRPVALKMILAGAHADAAEKIRFSAEAEAAGRLSHANIVQLYEVGVTPDGFPFFSLEFIAGGTLAERLRQGPFKPDEAAALVEALARAMQYAHQRNIVHRDLKPGNILLTRPADSTQRGSVRSLTADGSPLSAVPKISDFGLAKQLDTDDGLTRTGAIMGTPSYMAPEQAFGQSKNVGPAADIYALGAILYECLTGRPPFKGATVADTLEQVRTMEPISVKALVKEIPADLGTICLHCLHKEPQRRYASAEALADDLRRFLEHRPISVRPVGNVERVWRWCRRNPGWAAVFATIAVLLCSITGVSLGAYYTVAAQNEVIQKQNQDIKNEITDKEKQTLRAQENETKAVGARKDAEDRLDQSVATLKLFANDVRVFSEDALLPAASKQRLFDAFMEQLESQASASASEEFNEDKLRARIFLYETVALTQIELGRPSDAIKTLAKPLKLADQWLKHRPEDPAALGRRAAIVHLIGTAHERNRVMPTAHAHFTEAHEIRNKLLGNEKVERFTPGKTITDLADSLDALKRWDEAIELRLRALAVDRKHIEITKGKPDEAFTSLDNLNWTYQKAAEDTKDLAKQKEYLDKANETSLDVIKLRPTARKALERWVKALGQAAELEKRLASLAKDAADRDEHLDAARKHYVQIALVTSKLTTGEDLYKQRHNLAAAHYEMGRVAKRIGRRDLADEHFNFVIVLTDELTRDYGTHQETLRLDRLHADLMLGKLAQVTTATESLHTKGGHKNQLLQLAKLYVLCIPAVEEARRPGKLTAEDKKLQKAYLDKAVDCFRRAFEGGFRELHQIDGNPDFDVLRNDPRYRAIVGKEKEEPR